MLNEFPILDPLERKSSLKYLSEDALQHLLDGPCPNLVFHTGGIIGDRTSFVGYTYAFTQKGLLSEQSTPLNLLQQGLFHTVGKWMARIQGVSRDRIRAIDIIVEEDLGKVGTI